MQLFGTSSIRRKARKLAVAYRNRVTADGGIIQNYAFVVTYYEFMLRNFGTIPRRVYSSLAGVKLNDIAGTDYVSKMYDMNPISPIDAVQGTEASQPLWDTDADCSHRILRFDGSDDYFTIDDLAIIQNKTANSFFILKKSTYNQVDIGAVLRLQFGVASTKIGLDVNNSVDSAVARRTEADTAASVSTTGKVEGFNAFSILAVWVANTLAFYKNKTPIGSTSYSSGGGMSENVAITRFWIGNANAGNRAYRGVISEFIASDAINTQAKINALHEFFKQYYPTLP